MSEDELRATIARAAVPMLASYDTVTTGDIARAAGVDEAALLAVFDDKDAVLRAGLAAMQAELAAALDPAEAVRQLDAIPVDRPLAPRLVAVIHVLEAHHDRVRTRLDAIVPGTAPARPAGRENMRVIAGRPEIEEAVTRLLAPDREHLRLPSDVLARAFLGLVLGAARTPDSGHAPLPADQLVDVFLHGVVPIR